MYRCTTHDDAASPASCTSRCAAMCASTSSALCTIRIRSPFEPSEGFTIHALLPPPPPPSADAASAAATAARNASCGLSSAGFDGWKTNDGGASSHGFAPRSAPSPVSASGMAGGSAPPASASACASVATSFALRVSISKPRV